MGGRYLITGVQIGMLLALDKKEQEELLKDIQEKQWVGDSENNIEDDVKKVDVENILEAWHNVFGTTQLDHAKARLERVEADRLKYREALEKTAKDLLSISDIEVCNIINFIQQALEE